MSPEDEEIEFQFVHVGQKKSERSESSCTTSARSHVMKQSHRRKQLQIRQNQQNFYYVTPGLKRDRRRKAASPHALQSPRETSLAVTLFDPFHSLAADPSEMPSLLASPLARQAGEPIVNFNITTGYQGLNVVFRSGLEDPALINAMLMTLSLAVHGDPGSVKFLTYKGEALRFINRKMQDPSQAMTAGTIGAILLFVGVEARLGAVRSVQLHMRGIAQLLRLCDSKHVFLHDGIKRAIFWQDLFSAMITGLGKTTGSGRVMSHEDFSELSWKRDPLQPSMFCIPIGFERHAALLGDEYLAVAADIKALQMKRDTADVDHGDPISIMHLDNQQASIESRLYNLGRDPLQFTNPILYCSLLTSYLCTYMLFTEVWASTLIPVCVNSTLLWKLKGTISQAGFTENPSLFTWIACIGGTFASSDQDQVEYARLLRQQMQYDTLPSTRAVTEDVLNGFVWSEKIFGKRWNEFWSRVVATAQDEKGNKL